MVILFAVVMIAGILAGLAQNSMNLTDAATPCAPAANVEKSAAKLRKFACATIANRKS
jgi:hypothetical protein